MSNYCTYMMKVKGSDRKHVEEFIKVMRAKYNYKTECFSFDRHIGERVFEAFPDKIEKNQDGTYSVIIEGYCAWSVKVCMFDGEFSYYKELCKQYKERCRSTTIPIESKRLNLEIEIFSEESGFSFMEHFVVKNGTVEVEDCADYQEYYVAKHKTKEAAEAAFEIEFTDEEWENRGDCIYRGGIEWNFEI